MVLRAEFLARRGIAIAVTLALSTTACLAVEPAADPATARFDGIYQGSSTPDASLMGCGTASHPVKIEVSAGRIWVRTHHRHRRLTGTVGPDGQVSMQGAAGARLTGSIQNGTLTASEIISRKPRRSKGLYDSGQADCTTTFTAARVS